MEKSNLFVDDQGNLRMVDKHYYSFIVGPIAHRYASKHEHVAWGLKLINYKR